MLTKLRKGQNTLEYAIVIAVVVGALVAMQIYMKRSVSGKLRDSTESIGTQYDIAGTSSTTTTRTGMTQSGAEAGKTFTVSNDTTTEDSTENIDGWFTP